MGFPLLRRFFMRFTSIFLNFTDILHIFYVRSPGFSFLGLVTGACICYTGYMESSGTHPASLVVWAVRRRAECIF